MNFQTPPLTKITKEWVLDKISEDHIFSYYFGDHIQSGKLYRSKLRSDKNPTCSFYKNRNKQLKYHDFATGDNFDCFQYVMKLYGQTFHQALIQIVNDFNLDPLNQSSKSQPVQKYTVQVEERRETLIQIKPKAFSEQELKWWKGFGVTERTLKKYKVFSCDSIFLNGDYFSSSSPRVPIYGYYCGKKNGQELWRIYFPSKRSFRFLSNVGKSYIQGAKQLPKTGDILLVTKSQKDVMLAYELGIPAIAPCSEVLFLSNKQIQHLKKRFKTIVVCYDTDITGIHNLKQIKVKHPDLHTFFIPRKYGVKDISDFFKKYGEEETRRLAGELLQYYRSISDRKEE
jgi:hypothetical protein